MDCNDIRIYEIFREYIRHEDNLENYRITWVLASQAFIFTAYAALFIKKHDIARFMKRRLTEVQITLVAIAFIGVVVSGFGFISINASHVAMENIVNTFHAQYQIEPSDHDKIGNRKVVKICGAYLPDLVAGGAPDEDSIAAQGNLSSISITSVMSVIWSIVFFFNAISFYTTRSRTKLSGTRSIKD